MKRIVIAFIFLSLPALVSAQIHDAATALPKRPLYILDNNVVSKEKIDTSKVVFVKTLKGAEANAVYGVAGADGVLIYETKPFVIRCLPTLSKNSEPLFVVNGAIKKRNFIDKLIPDSVSNIEVLKGNDAVKKYGSKAVNGVLIITTKSGNKKVKS